MRAVDVKYDDNSVWGVISYAEIEPLNKKELQELLDELVVERKVTRPDGESTSAVYLHSVMWLSDSRMRGGRSGVINRPLTLRCREGGQRLIMPQDTRWNTMSDCLKIYIKNWPILMKISEVDREKTDQGVRNKVSNLVVKRSAEELLTRLEPIAEAQDKVQSDKCTIAEAVDIWKGLCTCLGNTRGSVKTSEKRFNQVITKAHLLANMVHLSLQGKALSEETIVLEVQTIVLEGPDNSASGAQTIVLDGPDNSAFGTQTIVLVGPRQ
ncbi:hypothetical protein Hamer_G000906 [Homarus americanus]|uniref:Uncharacterized protein n=1 Tax=Homarus americanus TaxID=6706 RepID=A0A8J5N2J5_HOMAM|nr:hypothetical protein Hamer_G000906 [Homarus americanus]